ncbi:hypothetical protein HDU93_000370 [Gonapodya sp. JEL0774]|nr:hypothetical protein HDU93_000370 [Gonapodya sp. JEL0774]
MSKVQHVCVWFGGDPVSKRTGGIDELEREWGADPVDTVTNWLIRLPGVSVVLEGFIAGNAAFFEEIGAKVAQRGKTVKIIPGF